MNDLHMIFLQSFSSSNPSINDAYLDIKGAMSNLAQNLVFDWEIVFSI